MNPQYLLLGLFALLLSGCELQWGAPGAPLDTLAHPAHPHRLVSRSAPTPNQSRKNSSRVQ